MPKFNPICSLLSDVHLESTSVFLFSFSLKTFTMFVHCKEKKILEEILKKIAQSNASAMNLSMASHKEEKKIAFYAKKKVIDFTSTKAKMK